MYVYVISLRRSGERRRHMRSELEQAGLDWEFVDAVDGLAFDLGDLAVIGPSARAAGWFNPASAACELSHLAAHRRLLEDGRDCALVLEDDVCLTHGAKSLLESLEPHLSGAQVALLNYDSPQLICLSEAGSERLPGTARLLRPAAPGLLRSAAGYVITHDAAARLVTEFTPVSMRLEEWGRLCAEGVLDQVRCVHPMPITKSLRFESTLWAPGGVKGRVLRYIMAHDLPAVQHFVALRRARIQSRQTRVMVTGDSPVTADGR